MKEVECIYSTQENETRNAALKRENNSLRKDVTGIDEFFSLLRSMTEEQSQATIRYIRDSQVDPANIIAANKKADPEVQRRLSPIKTAAASLPPMQSYLEFQLITYHLNAYSSFEPLHAASIDLSVIDVPFHFVSGAPNRERRKAD